MYGRVRVDSDLKKRLISAKTLLTRTHQLIAVMLRVGGQTEPNGDVGPEAPGHVLDPVLWSDLGYGGALAMYRACF